MYFLLGPAVYIQLIKSGINIFSGLFYEDSTNQVLLSSPFIKPQPNTRRLTKKQQQAFSVPSDLQEALVGLILGDLCGRLRFKNVSFTFKQGLIHQDEEKILTIGFVCKIF